jgi:filamentous hemagglutinin
MARQFAERLGFTARDAEDLREQLLKAVLKSEDAEPIERDDYGQRYVLDVEVKGPKGQATVRTTWIAREGERGPKLLTCHVREEGPHAARKVA